MKPKHQIWKNEITIRRRKMEIKWNENGWWKFGAIWLPSTQLPGHSPFKLPWVTSSFAAGQTLNIHQSLEMEIFFFSGPKKLQVYSPRFPDNMLDKLSWLQLTGYLIGQSGPLLWLPIIYITLISSYKKVSSRFGNSNKVSTLKTMITKAIKYLDPSASFALRPCSAIDIC